MSLPQKQKYRETMELMEAIKQMFVAIKSIDGGFTQSITAKNALVF
jgi:hypothetical protein